MKLKQEEEEEMMEEEEMVVEYMDSDEEEKKERRTKVQEAAKLAVEEEKEVEEVEEEELYTFPPMEEWVPTEKPKPSTFLSFCPVELPSSGGGHSETPVRSTILGPFGRSVIMAPPPDKLPWEKRHRRSALMMVTTDQLRAHLSRQVEKSRPQGRGQSNASLCRATDRSLEYELRAAVTPLIGNLLIPTGTRRTSTDALRERAEERQFSSTPVFLLLLQTMNVDSVGCKEMIENRRRGLVFQAPPPGASSARMNSSQTVAGMLQQRKRKEEHQVLDQEHNLILDLLQAQAPPAPHWPVKQRTRPQILLRMCPDPHHQLPPADLGRTPSSVEVRASGD